MNDDTQDPKKKQEEVPAEENHNEIDTSPTDEIMTTDEANPIDLLKQEPSEQEMNQQTETSTHEHSHGSAPTDPSVPSTLIKINNGKFICSECENEVEPETNTIEGVVKANLEQIKQDLTDFPTKVIYGICPVCGMEFVFRLKNDELYLEPSDLEK